MSDLITYRIDFTSPVLGEADALVLNRLHRIQVIETDLRLQRIAGATKCEHDLIDEHEGDWEKGPDGKAFRPWCMGAPELRGLFDALAERGTS